MAEPSPPTLEHCRVVLTDDDELVRTVYAAALRMRGCEVIEARDGAECVSLARAVRPDLVLLDLNMPGADGWDTIAALRSDELTCNLVVLALSGEASSGVRRRALEAGFDDFVEKPFTPAALLRDLETAWRNALARGRGGGSAALAISSLAPLLLHLIVAG